MTTVYFDPVPYVEDGPDIRAAIDKVLSMHYCDLGTRYEVLDGELVPTEEPITDDPIPAGEDVGEDPITEETP